MPRPYTIVCELCGGKFFKHSFAIHQKQCISKVEASTTHCPVCGLVVSNDEYRSHVSGCKKLKEEYKARAARSSGRGGRQAGGRGRGGRSGRGRGRGQGGAGARSSAGGGAAGAPAAPSAPEPGVQLMSKVPDYIKKRYAAGADGEPPADPLAELLEKPTKAIHCMNDIPEFADGGDDGRMECEYCGRKFNRGRIAKHQLVCANAQARDEERKAKVKPMDGKKLRLKGTEFLKAKRAADRDTKHREYEAKVAASTANGWRYEHIRMQQIAHADDDDGGHAAAAAAADEAKAHRERLAAKAAEAARTLNRDAEAAEKIESAHGLPSAAAASAAAAPTMTAVSAADAEAKSGAPPAASGAGAADPLNTTATSTAGKGGPKFHVGDRIRFKSDGRVGFVRFRGPVWGLNKGTWLGVEVRQDCGSGKHSGECKGVPYFHCEVPGQGCFTRRDRVEPYPPSTEEQEAEYKRIDQENERARKEVLGMVKAAKKGKGGKKTEKSEQKATSGAKGLSYAGRQGSSASAARAARAAAADRRNASKAAPGKSVTAAPGPSSGRSTARGSAKAAPGPASARSRPSSKPSGAGSTSPGHSPKETTRPARSRPGSGAGTQRRTGSKTAASSTSGPKRAGASAAADRGAGRRVQLYKRGQADGVALPAAARGTQPAVAAAGCLGGKRTSPRNRGAGASSNSGGSAQQRGSPRSSPGPVAGRRAGAGAGAGAVAAASGRSPAAAAAARTGVATAPKGRAAASAGTASSKPAVPTQRKPKRDALDKAMQSGGGAGYRRSRPASGRARAAASNAAPAKTAGTSSNPTIDEMRAAKEREIERNAAFLRALAGKGSFPEGMAPSTAGGGTTAGTRDAIAQAQQPYDVWARSGAKKQGQWGRAQRVGGGSASERGKAMLSQGSGRKLGVGAGGGSRAGASAGAAGARAAGGTAGGGLKRASSLRQAGSMVAGAGSGAGAARAASGSARVAGSGRSAGGGKAGSSGAAGKKAGGAGGGDSRRAARAAYFDRLLKAKSGNE